MTLSLSQLARSFQPTPVKSNGRLTTIAREKARPSNPTKGLTKPGVAVVGPYSRKEKPTRTGKYPVIMKDGERVFLWFETDTESWYRMTEVNGSIKYKRISTFHIESWSGITHAAYKHEKACILNENRRQGNYWPGVAELGGSPF